jgi:polyferredoxin
MIDSTFPRFRHGAAYLQAALVLGLPFMKVSGESALRFDIPSLKLFFFGNVIWISETTFFLLVFLLIFTGIMLVTALYGRAWCAFACPQAVLSALTHSIERAAAWLTRHRGLRIAAGQGLLLALAALVSANLISYFVSPYDLLADARAWSLGPWTFWTWVLFTGLIHLNLAFAQGKACRSVCPYDRFARFVLDPPSDEETPDDAGPKNNRTRLVVLSAAFALIAALFAWTISVRMPVDFQVTLEDAASHHNVDIQGTGLNTYVLLVENRTLQPEAYRLSISGIKDARLMAPYNPLVLPPATAVKMKVIVSANRKDLVHRVTRLHFILESASSREIRITQEASFVYPDRTDRGVEI